MDVKNVFLRFLSDDIGAGTFQKVVRLGLKNERSRREDRGAERVVSGKGVSPPQPTMGSGGAS